MFGEMKRDGRKPSIDEPAWLSESGGEFLLMCLVHNVKKIVREVLEGTVSLSGSITS